MDSVVQLYSCVVLKSYDQGKIDRISAAIFLISGYCPIYQVLASLIKIC